MPTQSVFKATLIGRSATQAALLLRSDRPCQILGRRGSSIEVCQVIAAPVHLPDLGQWVAGARGQALLRPHAGPRSSPSPMRRVCAQRMRRAFPSSKCFTCDSIASMSRLCLFVKTHVFCSIRMATDGDSSSSFRRMCGDIRPVLPPLSPARGSTIVVARQATAQTSPLMMLIPLIGAPCVATPLPQVVPLLGISICFSTPSHMRAQQPSVIALTRDFYASYPPS